MSDVVAIGGAAAFSVTATGKNLTYQWFKGSAEIPGATASTFSIAETTLADYGTYYVRVTNDRGGVNSTVANLTQPGAPVITTQPEPAEVANGSSVTLTVVAEGDAPLTYQWSRGGVEIPGAINATYTINPVSEANTGLYWVVVTNAKGSATSFGVSVTLVVEEFPTILQQPASQTVATGSPASFSVQATGGALTYQWRKNGTPIGGATGATYTIPTAASGDEGSYTVVVTNSQGNVTSAPATLAVADPPVITSQPQSLNVDPGGPATFSVTATGAAPLSYQWTKNGAAINGATNATFTIASVTASDAGTYRVTVTNVASTVTSLPATLSVNTPPAIVQQPRIVVNGGSTSLTVVATGSPAPTYQWYRDNVAVDGATSATLTLGTVNAGNRGIYRVVVANVVNSVTSDSVNVQ